MLTLEIIGVVGLLYGMLTYTLVRARMARHEGQLTLNFPATTGGAR